MGSEIIYHYCSMNTFLSILQNGTIRVSDIKKMNDFAERKWVYQRLLQQMQKQDFYTYFDKYGDIGLIREMEIIQNDWETYFLPGGAYSNYIFCLSSSGDLLSQWRAYADDGCGVAIGFNKNVLLNLTTHSCFELGAIQYYNDDMATQKVEDIKISIKRDVDEYIEKNIGFDIWGLILKHMRIDNYYLFKNPAFSEESEWRLIFSPDSLTEADKDFKIANFLISAPKYRVTRNNVVGYREIDFTQYKESIISKIIIGPKCKMNPHIDLQEILYYNGFPNGNIAVEQSKATYK